MTAQVVEQKRIVDANGNITIHGRSGIRLAIRFRDGADSPQNVTQSALYIEIANRFRKALEPAGLGFATDVRWLVLTQDEAALLPAATAPAKFVIIDETDVEPDGDIIGNARWSGTICRSGFAQRPGIER